MHIRTDTEIVLFNVATTEYHLNSVIVKDSNLGRAHIPVHLSRRSRILLKRGPLSCDAIQLGGGVVAEFSVVS